MKTSPSQAKNQSEAGNLFFSDSLKYLVGGMPSRSQEIIFSRYGVFASHTMTLEEIGKKYHVTRERVRQIIREVLRKVREKKDNPTFLQIQEKISLALRTNGGIMEKKQLLFVLGKGNVSEEAAISFFLECIGNIAGNEISGELKFSYAMDGFDIERWRVVKNAAIAVLKSQKNPLTFDELFKKINTENENLDLSRELLANYLEVSDEIKRNTFDKWGISKWKEISPKGTREKAYLVLKESGKPLHFRDIAKEIDKYHLNKKKTHPQTVHNELIKDNNFVLVGRGIYALVEWGYKKGTVKDVIEEILKNSQRPLNREEVLSKVLDVRQVKKSTIVINLNNFFSKSNSGAYSIKK